MSNTKMLIDATHPEETRVVVQRNGRVEEFDFESAARKLLRGNIYLAKVTRVEPSLQAAFVDYGGNRHGFLAFNEIHPDYYQIPVADRQALLDEEAAAEAELEAAADRRAEQLERRAHTRHSTSQPAPTHGAEADDEDRDGEAVDAPHIVDVEEDEHIEEVGGGGAAGEEPAVTVAARVDGYDDVVSEPTPGDDAGDASRPADDASETEPDVPEAAHHEAEDDEDDDDGADDAGSDVGEGEADGDGEIDSEAVNDSSAHSSGAEDGGAPEATQQRRGRRDYGDDSRPRRRPRSYKIQEVIKRRQIILVQVVKEERGNKGAALTTYLSLAGRYTVLMPNTARGGGISRKITNPQDRKRLKAIAQELDVPEGMGLIIRTAGAARTKQEIKRDFEYLLRLWESVRELTLQSTAPALVYEEGDLIKRSIRDLYNKDVEEVVVAGDAGYEEASAFMRMLMPSHAKNVVAYREPAPLFARYGVERQLNAMFLPQVTLRSGGYIVINQTEALVAIDVNSGKSTREFSIEETALATNLEASDEIARQLKLRDLAGLIVIDFIDMEEKRNNRAVERRLKDALRFDRARIQLGRISHFGLMEMSRQRLRTGVLEGSTSQCPHCVGTGIIRSTESIALAVLRGLEDTITAGASAPLIATTTPSVALYILNSKRAYITEMEQRHGHVVTILGSDRVQGANFTIERGVATAVAVRRPERAAVNMDWGFEGEGEEEAPSFETADIEIVGDNDDPGAESRAREGDDDGQRRNGRRRRRGRGRGDRGTKADVEFDAPRPTEPDEDAGRSSDEAEDDGETVEGAGASDPSGRASPEQGAGEKNGRRRRRGRRGGRRGRDRNGSDKAGGPAGASADGLSDEQSDEQFDADVGAGGPDVEAPSDEQSAAEIAQKPGRSRSERIWDKPAATNDDGRHDAPANDVSETPVVAENSAQVIEAIPEPPAVRRHETGSSEPRIERVVVRPDQIETAAGEAAASPQRKGWWQRRFGAE